MSRNLKSSTAATAALGAALLPAAAHAHPGPHEGGAGGLLHAVTQPDHLLALLLIGAAVLWAPRVARRAATLFRRRSRAAAARGPKSLARE
jgi:hydrogenase/urease accessory protein HupE